MQITFVPVTLNDISTIQKIAAVAWPDTFGPLMSADQLAFMMDMMYSTESLTQQIAVDKHQYFLVKLDGEAVGYTAYEANYKGEPNVMIHKAYLHPKVQRQGVGSKMFTFLESEAKRLNNTHLRLRVFVKNIKAINFYKKYGFYIDKDITVDIGAYLLYDHVMLKAL